MSYFVEYKTYPYAISAVQRLSPIPHIHTHLEMVYLTEGEAVATCDRKEYRLRRGEIFFAFPNQIHSYENRGELRGYLMIFSSSLSPLLEKLLTGRIPASPVVKVDFDAEAILAGIREKKLGADPFGHLCALGEFLSFLSASLPLFSYVEDAPDYDSMQKILAYLADHFTEEITLEHLSRLFFLSKYYISHLFRSRMEMNFHEFLSFLRVNRACELLEKPGPVTQIALASGFSSVRTFNRVFRSVMDQTPAQYRKSRQ